MKQGKWLVLGAFAAALLLLLVFGMSLSVQGAPLRQEATATPIRTCTVYTGTVGLPATIPESPGGGAFDYVSVPMTITDVYSITLRTGKTQEADITISFAGEYTDSPSNANIRLCPPAIGLLASPWTFPNRCINLVGSSEFQSNPCSFSITMTDDQAPANWSYVWDDDCPLSGTYSDNQNWNFWRALIYNSPTGGEATNGVWRLYAGSNNNENPSAGSITGWSLNICDNPTATPTPTFTPTATATSTATSTPTNTPVPTATPTPDTCVCGQSYQAVDWTNPDGPWECGSGAPGGLQTASRSVEPIPMLPEEQSRSALPYALAGAAALGAGAAGVWAYRRRRSKR